MIGRILSVGGLTLLSRVVGFARDVLMAAVLGAGPVADAFLIAFRLPNHFRSIFAEGAFNAAFVPAYARVRTTRGADTADLFADRIFTLLFISQAVLLLVALLFTGPVVSLLAPGLKPGEGRFELAVELTRITFPYLMCMVMVTLFGGILNALQRFASAAAAPILLNLSMLATLMLAAWFPGAGHAAAWGVFIGGIAQFLLLSFDASRAGALPVFAKPKFDAEVKRFFVALGPAVVGSAGIQLALFADTIIASYLPGGALSALYYADRIYQLPIGVIGIAAGTVLLPEMARRIAGGDEFGARYAQNRAIETTLVLAAPALVAFLMVPGTIMAALFTRGAFTAADAAAAGATLKAYAFGLLPFVLMRCIVATFHARGDTRLPVIASLTAIAINIGLKLLLMGPLAQVGLALATAAGAWINIGILTVVGLKRGLFSFDRLLGSSMLRLGLATAAMAISLGLAIKPFGALAGYLPFGREEAKLLLFVLLGAGVYGGAIVALFGRRWLEVLRRRRARSESAPTQT